MTTVIAIQFDDCVEMIADSQINSSGQPYFHPDMVKIVAKGKYLIGIAGRVVALQTIQNSWTPPALGAHKDSIYNFIIIKVIPSLKTFIQDAKIFSDKERDDDDDLFSILIAIKGELFEIDQDYSVSRREDGLYAIGSGSGYALGALLAGASGIDAMNIAASLDVNTSAPFITLRQDA
jgi:ATP-dependent protease HslVU (ClpYQ) peptidase subunit